MTSTTAERALRNGATAAGNRGPTNTSLARVRRPAALICGRRGVDANTDLVAWQPGDSMRWRHP
jgi:hypothetical protein